MKDASQYPITELYGCQPDYPLNQNLCPPGQGFHKGIDYGCPLGTSIIVNGVTIGISGATGTVTGPHLHVGKWDGGTVLDPGVGNGFNFNSAVVSDIGSDSVNGNYVKIKGDGYTWVYLHMSDNSKVSIGQQLKGGSMSASKDVVDATTVQLGYNLIGVANPDPSTWTSRIAAGQTVEQFLTEMINSPQHKAMLASPQATVLKSNTLYKTP